MALFYLTKTVSSRYVSHLSLHALTLHHKVDFLYETLIKEIQTLVKGIATLSKGYLPPELFPTIISPQYHQESGSRTD